MTPSGTRLAQVHSLGQSTIRVIQDRILCFLNRDLTGRWKEWTCTIRTVRFSSPLILLRSYCSKMNSSGHFEVKSQPIRWRWNSHSTFLFYLHSVRGTNRRCIHFLHVQLAKWIRNFTKVVKIFVSPNTSTAKYMCLSTVEVYL